MSTGNEILEEEGPRRSWGSRTVGAVLVYGLVVFPLAYLLYRVIMVTKLWRITHDTPIMMYTGFLVDRFDFVPYRDFFDMNLPGSYLCYALIGHFFGYGDLELRYADFACLALLSILIFAATARFGLRAALLAVIFCAFRYFRFGAAMSLQREYLAMLPIMAGVAVAVAMPRRGLGWRVWLSALFFGMAVTIKPHLLIGFIPVFFYFLTEAIRPGSGFASHVRAFVRVCLLSAFGGSIPVLIMIGYLLWNGVLGEFFDNAINYLPLYGSMTASHTTISGKDRLMHLLEHFLGMGGHYAWVASGMVGIFGVLAHAGPRSEHRRQAALLAGLALVYAIYPVFSGQFWSYHYLPFMLFLAMGTGLCFVAQPPGTSVMQRVVPVLLATVVVLNMFFHAAVFETALGLRKNRTTYHRADSISRYLRTNLRPGDTVQPVDWAASGVVHGMLDAEAKIATPFIYHFHFYHHISSPFIQKLRKRFLKSFNEAKPRFVVEGKLKRPFVNGYDTTTQFQEFEDILREQYEPVMKRSDYYVWERKTVSTVETVEPVKAKVSQPAKKVRRGKKPGRRPARQRSREKDLGATPASQVTAAETPRSRKDIPDAPLPTSGPGSSATASGLSAVDSDGKDSSNEISADSRDSVSKQ